VSIMPQDRSHVGSPTGDLADAARRILYALRNGPMAGKPLRAAARLNYNTLKVATDAMIARGEITLTIKRGNVRVYEVVK
jgi:hypothetical protein